MRLFDVEGYEPDRWVRKLNGNYGHNMSVGNITNAFLWKGPDYQVAKNWDNGCKSSVNFYQPTFDGNP